MKRLINSFVSVALPALLGAQTIPNPGFETWIINTETPQNYLMAQNWVTDDVVQSYFANDSNYYLNNVLQTTNAHSGLYAMELQMGLDSYMDTATATAWSMNSLYEVLPLLDQTGIGGFPISTRPANLNGYYQLNTGGGSIMGFCSYFASRWNTQTQSRDILINSSTSFTVDASGWTAFSIPLTYALSLTPDTFAIGFLIAGANSYWYNLNGRFIVDDLSFSGNVPIGMSEANTNPVTVNLFPNPVATTATIRVTGAELDNAAFELYDVMGNRVMRMESISGNTIEISREGLPSGMYFYNITGGGAVLVNGKLSVE